MENQETTQRHRALPTPDDRNETTKSLLLVLLTKLSPGDEERLIQHLQPPASEFRIKTWSPGNHLLRSIAPQGEYRDSQANLYALAICLHRTGRSSFVVADNLTKRQLEGCPIRGESEAISVVKIAVRPGIRDGQVRVLARRSVMASDENVSLFDAVNTFEVPQTFIADRLTRESFIYSDYGLELHDPDQGLFAMSTAESLAHKEISRSLEKQLVANIPLPGELVLEIASRANSRPIYPVRFPLGLSFESDMPYMNIFVAFKTTEEELKELQSALQEAVQIEYQRLEETGNEDEREQYGNDRSNESTSSSEVRISLIPWDHDRALSRRDVMRMRAETAEHPSTVGLPYYRRPQPEDILLRPFKRGEADTAQFVTIFQPPAGLVAVRTTLSNLVKEAAQYDKCQRFVDFVDELNRNGFIDSDKLEILPSREINSSHDDPFYSNPPPWEPVDRQVKHISLFYMTNKLTKEQDRALHNEIKSLGEMDDDDIDPKAICPVAWKAGQEDADDATLEYMWKVLNMAKRNNVCRLPFFFVDRQSVEDHTLLVMTKDLYFWDDDNEQAKELLKDVPNPRFRGLRYARIPGRDAHCIFANLSISNLDMEELDLLEDGIMKLPRPDWPGHGILFDDDGF